MSPTAAEVDLEDGEKEKVPVATAKLVVPEGYVLHDDDERPTTCCGKCCNPKKMMRPRSTDSVAIFPMLAGGCCEVGQGMEEDDMASPPQALLALGLDSELWTRFVLQELLGSQHIRNDFCLLFHPVTCCPLLTFVPEI